MFRYVERGEQRSTSDDEGKLFKIKLSGLTQIGQSFLDRFALGCRSCFRVVSDITPFRGRRQNGR